MRISAKFLISLSMVVAPIVQAAGLAADEKRPNPEVKRIGKFTIGKETTYVDGPVDKDGYIDYLSALNDRLRKGIKPADNACIVIWQAIGPQPEGTMMSAKLFDWLGIEPLPEQGDYFLGLARFAKTKLKLEPGKEIQTLEDEVTNAMRRPWTAKEFPRVAAWLKVNEKPLAMIAEAYKRPHYYYPLVMFRTSPPNNSMIGVSLSGVQVCRDVARAFIARAMLRTGQKEDGAWEDLLACHRLGGLIGRGATVIELLVGRSIQSVACRGCATWLQFGQPAVEQIEKSMQDLRKIPVFEIAVKLNLAERFLVLEAVMPADREGFEELKKGRNDPRAIRVLEQMNWDPALLAANRWFDRLTEAMREKDRSKRKVRLKDLSSESDALAIEFDKRKPKDRQSAIEKSQARTQIISHLLIALVFPAISKLEGTADKAVQERNNLIVAFALELYRRDKKAIRTNLQHLHRNISKRCLLTCSQEKN